MEKKERNYRNTVIAVMLACILTMAIGYAALQQKLEVKGTSKVDSVWDVRILGISEGTPKGGASNVFVPEFTVSTADFSTNLVSPGDSMTYDITIKNNGTLDAEVKGIQLNYTANPAIEVTHTGIVTGDTLLHGAEDHLFVTVKYSDSVTTQPESVNANFNVVIDYKQYLGN